MASNGTLMALFYLTLLAKLASAYLDFRGEPARSMIEHIRRPLRKHSHLEPTVNAKDQCAMYMRNPSVPEALHRRRKGLSWAFPLKIHRNISSLL